MAVQKSADPVSVLFVCTGNICRSTMAEGVFQHITMYKQANQNAHVKQIDSCGTTSYHTGDGPDDRTMSVLEDNKITSYRHAARRLRSQDFKDFDYILAMDRSHLRSLKSSAQTAIQKGLVDESAMAKIQLFGVYGGRDAGEEVPDPYYGDRQGFVDVYKQVSRCSEGLLKHIEDKAAKKGSL